MSAKQVVNMCVNVIKVSIHLGNWSHVLNYVNKAENTSELAEVRKQVSYYHLISDIFDFLDRLLVKNLQCNLVVARHTCSFLS